MTLVIPPGYMQVAFRFALTGDTEPMITTQGYKLHGGGDIQDEVDALKDRFLAQYPAAQFSNQWQYLGVVARVGQDGGPPAIYESPATVTGSGGATNTLANNCAVLVKKATGLGGRWNRGRSYVPPFMVFQDQVDSKGFLSSTWHTANDTKILSWLAWDAADLTGPQPVILHDSAVAGAPLPTVIVNHVIDPRIATQRRRLRP